MGILGVSSVRLSLTRYPRGTWTYACKLNQAEVHRSSPQLPHSVIEPMALNLHDVPSSFPPAGGRLHRFILGGIGKLPVTFGQQAWLEQKHD